jgi:hypothetical protein
VRGLIVRQPFADLIASGRKTWELRRRPIRITGRFYILAAARPDPSASGRRVRRLGVAVATAEQFGLIGPLSVGDLMSQANKHCASNAQLLQYANGKSLYAMQLKVTRLKQPRRYEVRAGAVTTIREVKLI